MASLPGFEPRPHWWEASALTTNPPLIPSAVWTYKCYPVDEQHVTAQTRPILHSSTQMTGSFAQR